jgi:hypothetical protein
MIHKIGTRLFSLLLDPRYENRKSRFDVNFELPAPPPPLLPVPFLEMIFLAI